MQKRVKTEFEIRMADKELDEQIARCRETPLDRLIREDGWVNGRHQNLE